MSPLYASPEFISKQVHDSDYFFADLSPDFRKDFVLVCGGLEYCDKDYLVRRKKFDFYVFEYIVSGQCEVTLDGTSYELHAGSIYGYTPSTSHTLWNRAGNHQLAKYFVSCTGRLVEELFESAFSSRLQPRQISNLRTMTAMFRHLLECGKSASPQVQRRGRLLVELIALETQANTVGLDDYHLQSHATFQRCRAYLELNYRMIQSVADFAARCSVSAGYLSRIFKQYANESPYESLLRLKLNRSAELLQRRDSLVKEVAEDIGFEDPYHFSRVFKQHFGISPKHFRETMKRH